MKKAWIENGLIRDVAQGDPADLFVAEIAVLFNTDVPDDAAPGWRLEKNAWVAPAAPPETLEPIEALAPEPSYRLKLTPSEFRNAFSAFEEVAIVDFSEARPDGEKAETTTLRKVVGVFFDRLRDKHLTTVDLEDPRNLAGLDLLVSVGILSAARRTAIAQGLPA